MLRISFRALITSASIAWVLVCLAGCGSAPMAAPPERPHDPWVFRSVLDQRARMITIALDEDLWVAYDATHGALYEAWKGGVDLEGAVYTHEHGPQPRTRGISYFTTDPTESPWRIERDDQVVATTTEWRGHAFVDGHAQLHYSVIPTEGGASVEILETPEVIRSGDRVGLTRRFRVSGLVAGDRLVLSSRAGSLVTSPRVEGTRLVATGGAPESHPWGETQLIDFDLVLGNGRAALETFFDSRVVADVEPAEPEVAMDEGEKREVVLEAQLEIPLAIEAPTIDGEIDELWSRSPKQRAGKLVFGTIDDAADLQAEFRLLYDANFLYVLYEVQDDRYSNDTTQTFHDDAVEVYIDGGNEKGTYYDDNDCQYVFGIGDTEFWVNSEPARHVGLEFASEQVSGGYVAEVQIPWANLEVDVRPGKLIGLEIHIDDDDDGKEMDAALAWFSPAKDSWSDPGRFGTVVLGGAPAEGDRFTGAREPGVALRLYSIGRSMSELVRLVPGQTPNVNRVIPKIDLRTAEDFGGLEDLFIAEITGYLSVEQAGDYEFRLTSDDGSRLWISGGPVIDHDGLHSAEPRDGRIELAAGDHPLEIRYFESAGGQQLTLEWRPPGQAEFSAIPTARLFTQSGEVHVTSPGLKRIIEPRTTLTPGDTAPLVDVHPSYTLSTARPESFEPRVGGLDFLPDGRLAVCTWDPDGAVYLLDGVETGDPARITVKRIAAGLAEPLGLTVLDGRIFVLQKQELTELIDHDGDDIIDEYRCHADGWDVTANFHEFAFGLVHKDDHFYATLATAIKPGGPSFSPQLKDRGRGIEIDLDGNFRFIASGFRTPNGIGLGVDGEVFVADNQGDWLPASKVVHLREGGFFGNRSVDPEGTRDLVETPPMVWMPQGEIGNSPSTPILLRDGPYAGQMAVCEVTHGGLKRIFVEKIDGEYQGALFRFCQGLEAGSNRVTYGPDGALYVGGIGSTGNWGQEGKLRFGLERLEYNGTSTFEMLAVRALANGLEVEFTEALPPGVGWNPIDYSVSQWRYEPTEEYGGPKIDEESMPVKSASVSDDRRRVFLEVPGLAEAHVVYLRLVGPFASESGHTPWSTECWYTLNKIPADRVGTPRPEASRPPVNTLSAAEFGEGFEQLFDGKSLSGWRGYRADTVPSAWRVDDGSIVFDPTHGGEHGDLTTGRMFQDFELRLDWKVAEGGNSGVMFRVTEDHDFPWETGPEMQILDNDRHADGRSLMTSAGSCYALYPASFDAAREAGLYNQARLVVRGDHVEHWLNGYKVVEYTLHDAAWQAKVKESKFSGMPDYGLRTKGHVVFQDHGDPVWFRNVRIRDLGPPSR